MIYQAAANYYSNLPYSENLDRDSAFLFPNKLQNHYIPKYWFELTLKDYYGILKSLFPNEDTGYRIDFEDICWDFYPFFNSGNSSQMRISFISVKDSFIRDSLKFYGIYLLSIQKKPQTVCLYLRLITSVFSKLDLNEDEDRILLDPKAIYQIVSKKGEMGNYQNQILTSLADYLDFVSSNYPGAYSIQGKDIRHFLKENEKRPPIERRYSLIPWPYFNKINEIAESVLFTESLDINDRIMAGIIIILSQTGLRIVDVLALATDCVEECTAPDGSTIHIINYFAHKQSKVYKTIKLQCYCNDLCYEAIKTILEIRKLTTNSSKSNVLITPDIGHGNRTNRNTLVRLYQSFMIRFLPDEVGKEWEGLMKKPLMVDSIGRTTNDCNAYGSIPTFHNYRVNVCTFLSESKMYSSAFIKHYMGHLSDLMDGYYSRPKDHTSELNDFSSKAMHAIIFDNAVPLGGRNDGDYLYKNIKEFISNNKVNILTESPMDILKQFKGQLSFRSLTGGCCIKIVGKETPCTMNMEGNDNRINCAYGACGNIYHFFYNLPETIAEFRMAVIAYKNATELGRNKDMDREMNRANYYARKAKEEMVQLRNVLQDNPLIKVEYPELSDTIDEIDIIEKELNRWDRK